MHTGRRRHLESLRDLDNDILYTNPELTACSAHKGPTNISDIRILPGERSETMAATTWGHPALASWMEAWTTLVRKAWKGKLGP